MRRSGWKLPCRHIFWSIRHKTINLYTGMDCCRVIANYVNFANLCIISVNIGKYFKKSLKHFQPKSKHLHWKTRLWDIVSDIKNCWYDNWYLIWNVFTLYIYTVQYELLWWKYKYMYTLWLSNPWNSERE